MATTEEKPIASELPATDVDIEKVAAEQKPAIDDDEFPSDWKKVALIMLAVYLSMFLVALDRTILGTAIPKITDEFHSIQDVGWYASSYLITSCACQLIYGRIYTFYSPKWVLLIAIGLFEVGSTICGAAPNSTAFILGRAIAGLGSAGIFSGAINIMLVTIPLHRRPMFQGIFGAIFGIASVLGPLVGGAFTTKVSWRWCFYINLPIGAVVIAIILFIMDNKPSKNTDTLRQQLMKLDPLGTIVFLPGIVCLLLALQWGGTTYAWSSARIIILFTLAGLLLLTFAIIQTQSGPNATVPIHIIKQRSVCAGMYYSLLGPGSMIITIYFLPLWFQAIQGLSAVTSGIDTLPLVLALVLASILSGLITAQTGYYTGQLLFSSLIMSIGAGLLTTLTPHISHSHWIAFEFIYGFGLGLGMQQAGMAAQTCLARKDVMTGVAIMFFMQGLGGSLFVSIAQTVFTHSLITNLGTVAKGMRDVDLTPGMIVNTGATELRNLVPMEYLPEVLVAYNHALSDALKVGLACAVATILAGLTMEWRSVKGLKHGGPLEAEVKVKEEAVKVEPGHGSDTEGETAPVVDKSEKL